MAKKKKWVPELSLYLDSRVQVEFARYSNRRLAIQLNNMYGEPYATATVNLVDEQPDKDCVFIKDYSENHGMLQWLVDNGIVEATGKVVPCGFVKVPEARLLEPWLKLAGGKTV